jgi:hypothetical protein
MNSRLRQPRASPSAGDWQGRKVSDFVDEQLLTRTGQKPFPVVPVSLSGSSNRPDGSVLLQDQKQVPTQMFVLVRFVPQPVRRSEFQLPQTGAVRPNRPPAVPGQVKLND